MAGSAAEPRLLPLVAGYAIGLLAHLRCRPDDVESVTKNELAIIFAGIAAALSSAALLVPALSAGAGRGGRARRGRDAARRGAGGDARRMSLELELERALDAAARAPPAPSARPDAVLPAEPHAGGARLPGRVRRRRGSPLPGASTPTGTPSPTGCSSATPSRCWRWPSAPTRCRARWRPRSWSARSTTAAAELGAAGLAAERDAADAVRRGGCGARGRRGRGPRVATPPTSTGSPPAPPSSRRRWTSFARPRRAAVQPDQAGARRRAPGGRWRAVAPARGDPANLASALTAAGGAVDALVGDVLARLRGASSQ